MGHVYADTDRTTSPTQNTERCDDMKKMLKKVLCAGLLSVAYRGSAARAEICPFFQFCPTISAKHIFSS